MVFATLRGVHRILPDRHRGNGTKTIRGNAMTRLSAKGDFPAGQKNVG